MRGLKRVFLLLMSSLTLSFPSWAAGNPDYANGAAAFARKDYVSAIASFESALQANPNDPNIHYGLASAFSAMGNSFQARCFYDSCIKLAPQSKIADNARSGLAFLDQRTAAVATSSSPSPTSAPATSATAASPVASFTPSYSSSPSPRPRLRKGANAFANLPPLPAPQGPGLTPTPQFYGAPSRSFSPAGYSPSSTTVSVGGASPYGAGASSYTPGQFTMPQSRHHGRGQFTLLNQSSAYSSGYPGYRGGGYGGYYSSTPQMVVRNYSFPNSSPGSSPTSAGAASAPAEPIAPVELLAKQEKLVVDEKHH